MYITPAQGLTLTSVLRGILGMCVLLFIAWLLSKDRKKIDWKIVVTGLSLQILLAFGMLYIPALQIFLKNICKNSRIYQTRDSISCGRFTRHIQSRIHFYLSSTPNTHFFLCAYQFALLSKHYTANRTRSRLVHP